jgi:hypothetical protein
MSRSSNDQLFSFLTLLIHFFKRRRKTLLWLDANPRSPENTRIRHSIPGHSSCQELEGLADEQLSLAAHNTGIALEDQVDVTLFTTVDAFEQFLSHPSQQKFVKYPPSLFRIVTNRRLFVGPNGMCSRMNRNAHWRSAFPAILVFHDGVLEGLNDLVGRPNLIISQVAADCEAFVSFQSVKAEVKGASGAATFALTQVIILRITICIIMCTKTINYMLQLRTMLMRPLRMYISLCPVMVIHRSILHNLLAFYLCPDCTGIGIRYRR